MKRVAIVAVVLAAGAALACGYVKGERPPFGSEKESALVAATVAGNVPKVRELLASGASPNQMVQYDGEYQSPWALALHQIRPRRPETVEIVKAMLKAGANTESAWGTIVGSQRSSRVAQDAMMVAMLHPDAGVVRAFVDAGLDPRLGQMPLVMAIESGEIEIAHILVDGGVDVNCHPGANTPLTAAIEARNEELMTYLEDHGARENP